MADNGEGTDETNNAVDGELSNSDPDENSHSSSSESEIVNKRRRTRTPSPTGSPNGSLVMSQDKQNSGYAGFFPAGVPPSPPKFVTFDQLMAAANGIKNMKLAHEIILDNNFKLEKYQPQENSLEKQVQDIMHRAFWDVLQEKMLSDPPDYSHALLLLEEVKRKLLALLLPQHVRLRTQINEVIDMELIKQKVDNDAFDFYYYANYVISIMGKLCAPVRDESIVALREISDVIPLFKSIFEVLGLMNMDMANFTIEQMRPYLQKQSVDYEKKKFSELLEQQKENGVDGLHFTRLWLQKSYIMAQEKSNSNQDVTLGATSSSSIVTPAAIMNEAYTALLQWHENETYPETLLMDKSRYQDMKEQTDRLILISSVLLVTYNTAGAPIAGISGLKNKLKSQISTILDSVPPSDWKDKLLNIADQMNKEVNAVLKEHSFPEWSIGQRELLTGQIQQILDDGNMVHKLIKHRVLEFIIHTISSKHTEPLKVPAGLSAVEQDLSTVCGQFLRCISHDRAVFGAYYANILAILLERKAGDLSPVRQ